MVTHGLMPMVTIVPMLPLFADATPASSLTITCSMITLRVEQVVWPVGGVGEIRDALVLRPLRILLHSEVTFLFAFLTNTTQQCAMACRL